MFSSAWKIWSRSPPRTNRADTAPVPTLSPPSHQGPLASPNRLSPNPKRRNTNPSPGSNSNRVLGLIDGKTLNKYHPQHDDHDFKSGNVDDATNNCCTLQEPPPLYCNTINEGMLFPPPHQYKHLSTTSTNQTYANNIQTKKGKCRTLEQVAIHRATILNEHGLELPPGMPIGPFQTVEELHDVINNWAKYPSADDGCDGSFSVKKNSTNPPTRYYELFFCMHVD